MITVSVKRAGRTLPAPLPIAPCAHVGPDSGPAGWHVCDHPNPDDNPAIPSGNVVCGTGCNGKCTPRCPGYEAKPSPAEVRLPVSAEGIGDHLMALSLAAGLLRSRPGTTLWLDAKPRARPWLALFAEAERLGAGPAGTPAVHDLADRGGLHYVEAASRAGPRALPTLKPLPTDAIAFAEPHRGAVVLCPRAASGARSWLASHWQALESLLHAAGLSTVVIGAADDQAELAGLTSPAHFGESPERVAALMTAASCVVANESGMAHLAGALAAPCVALAAQLDGQKVHGFWPHTSVIQGPLACSGCRWTGPHHRPACTTLCASLQAITPAEVFARVQQVAGKEPVPTLDELVALAVDKLGRNQTQWGRADRDRTIPWLLRDLPTRFPADLRVVETGCVRQRDDWGAGYAGWFFGALLEHLGRGSLVSVDNDPAHCATARQLLARWTRASVVESDSLTYLRARREPIDLAYLDSLDTYVPGHAEHGLAEAQAVAGLLSPRGMIVFDDSPADGAGGWRGKGRLAVGWLISQGWRVLPVSGYQTVLSR